MSVLFLRHLLDLVLVSPREKVRESADLDGGVEVGLAWGFGTLSSLVFDMERLMYRH